MARSELASRHRSSAGELVEAVDSPDLLSKALLELGVSAAIAGVAEVSCGPRAALTETQKASDRMNGASSSSLAFARELCLLCSFGAGDFGSARRSATRLMLTRSTQCVRLLLRWQAIIAEIEAQSGGDASAAEAWAIACELAIPRMLDAFLPHDLPQ